MFHVERCRECGDVKPLDAVGKCRWRAGCEHRQMVHEARMSQLNAELALMERSPRLAVQTLVPPPVDAAQLARWQEMVYEHVRQLMVDGETWINGERWYMPSPQPVDGWVMEARADDQGEPWVYPQSWPQQWPDADAPWIGPDTPDE